MTPEQQEKVQLLYDRFVARDDVYAVQWLREDGTGGWTPLVEQECTYGCKTKVCPHKTYAKLTPSVVFDHLQGNTSIGVYQLNAEGKVKWLCFDIDFNKGETPNQKDAFEVTRQIQKELRDVGIFSMVENSTNKGIHVWVFLEEELPTHVLFTFGRWIMEEVTLPASMHVEVFPKQSSSKRLGNLVRLPFGIHKKTKKRTHFLHPVTLKNLSIEEQWRYLKGCPPVTREHLKSVFRDHGIKSSPLPLKSQDDIAYRPRSQRCLVHLLNAGANEGLRDASVFRLACLLREYELPVDMATETLHLWNGTRNYPPLEPDEVDGAVESAYSANYSAYPCSDTQFDSICDPNCYWYENKMKLRNTRKSKNAYSSK